MVQNSHGGNTGHSFPQRESNRGVKGVNLTTNVFVAKVKNGEEVGDKTEKTARGQVVKDPEYHIMDTEISFFSNRESDHLNQSRMITFM